MLRERAIAFGGLLRNTENDALASGLILLSFIVGVVGSSTASRLMSGEFLDLNNNGAHQLVAIGSALIVNGLVQSTGHWFEDLSYQRV